MSLKLFFYFCLLVKISNFKCQCCQFNGTCALRDILLLFVIDSVLLVIQRGWYVSTLSVSASHDLA